MSDDDVKMVIDLVDTESKFDVGELVTQVTFSTDGLCGELRFEEVDGVSPLVSVMFTRGKLQLWFFTKKMEDPGLEVEFDSKTGNWYVISDSENKPCN